MHPPDQFRRRMIWGFWAVAILLGAIQAWSSRFDMAPDGIQYLDNADAYFRADWRNAANTQWSPMYAWLLGAALKLLKPSANAEFPVLHLVNFLVYLCALAAFQWFLSTLLRITVKSAVAQLAIIAVAWPAALYAFLDLTSIVNPTPDLTMAVFVFLLAALLVRIAAGDRGGGLFFAFGLTLGFGYLAKAPFFIFAALFLAIFAALVLIRRIALADFLLAAAAFLLVAVPYIAFLSSENGRLTYGDSGKYNLVWMVNGVPYYHWQGGPSGSGTPLHPTRKLSDHPAVYEFATPVDGTYPPWYDPIYWYQGARVQYRPADFLRAAVIQARLYFWLFHHRQLPLICGLVILVLLIPVGLLAVELRRFWPLLAFAVFPFLMFLPVHADGRFLGAFFTLLWTALFSVAILAARDLPPRTVMAISGTVAGLMLIEAALVAVPTPPLTGPQDSAATAPSRHDQQDIAAALAASGIRPGEKAAIVGSDLPYYWARLAHVKIVAQMLPDKPGEQNEETAEWNRGREILAATPAAFVIAPPIPGIVDQPGWQRLGSTEAFIYRLAR